MNKVTFNNKEFLDALAAKIENNMGRFMLAAQGETVRSISRSNHGGGNPSRVGEPPKAVTGQLRRTVRGVAFRRGNVIVGRLSAGTQYARRLELGFVGTDSLGRRINQGPRPFLRPSLKRTAQTRGKLLTQ